MTLRSCHHHVQKSVVTATVPRPQTSMVVESCRAVMMLPGYSKVKTKLETIKNVLGISKYVEKQDKKMS